MTFRHSLCQMNSLANFRNTCRHPYWPAVLLIDLGVRLWRQDPGSQGVTLICTLCILLDLKGGGLQNPWVTDAIKRHPETLAARNRYTSSQPFPDVNPRLDSYNNLMTLLPLERAAVIVISVEVSHGGHAFFLALQPGLSKSMTFLLKMTPPLFSIFLFLTENKNWPCSLGCFSGIEIGS